MNLSLADAFGKYGAKPPNRVRGLSAIAADGAVVLSCSPALFGHPSQGVLRYEDRLSREPLGSRDTGLLAQHLTLARDGALPIRMVVTSPVGDKKDGGRCHIRADLIGKVVQFDGDHFVVDFTRLKDKDEVAAAVRRRR
jgi:hypothetical protein